MNGLRMDLGTAGPAQDFMSVAAALYGSVERPPGRIVFASLSGSHMFGFPSADSDFDVRGCWLTETRLLHGLRFPPETFESSTNVPKRSDDGGLDLVLHEARKFFNLVLRNGNAIEQVHSPFVVESSPEHAELRDISLRCICRHHVSHYLGFADQQRLIFERRKALEVKPLLYALRILMTGRHLLTTGTVESNIRVLNEEMRLPFIDELIQRKLDGGERAVLTENHLAFYGAQIEELRASLERLARDRKLPDEAPARAELEDLLVRMRDG